MIFSLSNFMTGDDEGNNDVSMKRAEQLKEEYGTPAGVERLYRLE